MVSTSEFFKDKINWRVYNCIYDFCTILDDIEKFYAVYVNVYRQDPFGDVTYYDVYNDCEGFKKENEYKLKLYKEYYEKNGLVYSVVFDSADIEYGPVINKIIKCKGITMVVNNLLSGNFRTFRFKAKV